MDYRRMTSKVCANLSFCNQGWSNFYQISEMADTNFLAHFLAMIMSFDSVNFYFGNRRGYVVIAHDLQSLCKFLI